MAKKRSISEKPRSRRPRRIAVWLNPAGARKLHSLVDKIYKMKNLELAWEKVKRNKGADGIDGESIDEFEAKIIDESTKLAWSSKPKHITRDQCVKK